MLIEKESRPLLIPHQVPWRHLLPLFATAVLKPPNLVAPPYCPPTSTSANDIGKLFPEPHLGSSSDLELTLFPLRDATRQLFPTALIMFLSVCLAATSPRCPRGAGDTTVFGLQSHRLGLRHFTANLSLSAGRGGGSRAWRETFFRS